MEKYIEHGLAQKLPDPRVLLDLAERLFVSLLMAYFLYQLVPVFDQHPFGILLVLSEALVIVFVLFRRFGEAANTPAAWLAAIVGTSAPLLVLPGDGIQTLPPAIAFVLMLSGLMFSVAAKLFLRRSFGIVAANRGVQLGGPYRLVRHPMYLGYLLSHLGFLSLYLNSWNLVAYAVCWSAMLVRIRLEENILTQDPAYQAYKQQVRWRLIPSVW